VPSDDMIEGKVALLTETLRGSYQVEAQSAGKTYMIDQPVAVGGLGSGPDPYDLLCAALGACTSMTIRLYADQRHWPLHQVRVSVAHKRDVAPDRDHFERTIELHGDLDAAQREALLSVAIQSPVHTALAGGCALTSKLGQIGDPAEEARVARIEHWIAMEQALRAS
jgi:putative redox protein